MARSEADPLSKARAALKINSSQCVIFGLEFCYTAQVEVLFGFIIKLDSPVEIRNCFRPTLLKGKCVSGIECGKSLFFICGCISTAMLTYPLLWKYHRHAVPAFLQRKEQNTDHRKCQKLRPDRHRQYQGQLSRKGCGRRKVRGWHEGTLAELKSGHKVVVRGHAQFRMGGIHCVQGVAFLFQLSCKQFQFIVDVITFYRRQDFIFTHSPAPSQPVCSISVNLGSPEASYTLPVSKSPAS